MTPQTAVFSAFWLLNVLVRVLKLGDKRLNARVAAIAKACLAGSRCSLPVIAGREKGAVKGAQRLLSNKRVKLKDLRASIYEVTWEQAQLCKVLVVAFDPTLLDFSKQNQKKDRAVIGNGGGRGYTWLNSAAVDPVTGRFLGPLHQALVSANGPDDMDVCDYVLGATKTKQFTELLFNPKQQFLAHALMVHQRAPEDMELVFVADREFDDGLALRVLVGLAKNRHFVIRANDKRVVQVAPAPWLPANRKVPAKDGLPKWKDAPEDRDQALLDIYVHDLVAALPMQASRTLPLDPRGRVCPDGKDGVHEAQLSVGATRIRLARQSKRGGKAGISEVPVWLNLVVVRQTNAPMPGKKPLQWILLTDLPIDTREQIERVVDLYGCRWRIEEFFRTTKDTLKVEESELDDAESTARLLFFVTLKAMLLDRLRLEAGIAAGVPPTTQERKALEAGAQKAIKIEEERMATGKPPPPLSSRERATMTFGLIAYEGCWSSRNGDSLGNEILLRGLRVFLTLLAFGHYAWLYDDDNRSHAADADGREDVGS